MSESADAHLQSVVAITRVYADGLKVSAVAVQYDRNIKDTSLSTTSYAVKTDVLSQKITGVYTTSDGEYFTKSGQNGPWVVLELSTDYVIPVNTAKPNRPPNQGARLQGAPRAADPPPAAEEVKLALNAEVITKVGPIYWDPAAHPGSLIATGRGGNGKLVSLTQIGNIATADGATIAAGSNARENYFTRNLIVDGFMKPDFADATYGKVKYSIHFPRNFDPNQKYPLVIYYTDSNSVLHGVHAEALTQGNGAIVWADKTDEAKHPAVVLAPLPMGPLLDGNNQPAQRRSPDGKDSVPYQANLDLIDNLLNQFPNIDKDRVYLTGQGDGARVSMKMMSDRPDLFAAALLFAPDTGPSHAEKLANAKMWIVSSEGDNAAYPKILECVDSLQAAGARIGRATWNGQSTESQLASMVHRMTAQGNNIEFAVLKKGTVVPTDVPDDGVHNQAYTWRIGYSIEPLRDWLFAQKK